jgi:hypothetical protein
MLYEFFTFELRYRLKRAETYVFFLFLFVFSLFGVEFVFQGVDLGLVAKNSPLVIAKTMGAITGLSMIIASMIMGMPVLRDFQYDVTSIIYVNPISKYHYLLGKFLGSFVVLLAIFSSMLFGMMLAELMPWVDPSEYVSFQVVNYLQPFIWVALPIVFFGASLFFVTGALSKKLIVVYTQGLIIFVIFMLSKSIPNETIQALIDPFSLTTLTKISEGWTVLERNTLIIPVSGVMLYNKLLWFLIGMISLAAGYIAFRCNIQTDTSPIKKMKLIASMNNQTASAKANVNLPRVNPTYNGKAQIIQLLQNTWFHSATILKLTSFWALIICCFVIIIANSVSLGTTHGVDSYPTTYLIIEELQEMSIYFFMIMIVFYSGEIMWKEREAKIDSIYDASPINSFVNLSSRYLALLCIFAIVMVSLIVGGILFQTLNGYYRFEIDVYFFGFFLELFPYLALYTFAAMFFQAITGNKFLGMLATITFVIITVSLSMLGVEHVLLNFGGHQLASYSDMNGYGHFLTAYLWVKAYWMLFGVLLLIIASIVMANGTDTSLRKRWTRGLQQIGKPVTVISIACGSLFIGVGGYIFCNTKMEQITFRANYEKTLKPFEYITQPKIVTINLNVDLYPSLRAYDISGYYVLVNTSPYPIRDIHIQKRIDADIELVDVEFDRDVSVNNAYETYQYTIFELDRPLAPGDSMTMRFRQTLMPKGFDADDSDTDVVNNGTFFDNSVLPSFGYQQDYELEDDDIRLDVDLGPQRHKAARDDVRELVNARGGSDSDGVTVETIISTDAPQTALTAGDLIATWTEGGRSYYHFKSDQPIINFFPIVSARYEIMKDEHVPAGNQPDDRVDVEIYYHKGHEYNLDRMMESMKLSLDYFSTHFSAYQYGHLRIVEIPRYSRFAQSLPGIIPFSESIGFVMDIDDAADVDMAFYVTAHEVAHQWWGMQLEAANVQGQLMTLETLAQYSAMMVFKDRYADERVQQFLQAQLDAYNDAALRTKRDEQPLALVEKDAHIYYNKGALAMYAFQRQVGEESVNRALQRFLEDWRSFDNPRKPRRYATTADLIQYFRDETPDSMQHVVTELFQEVWVPDLLH